MDMLDHEGLHVGSRPPSVGERFAEHSREVYDGGSKNEGADGLRKRAAEVTNDDLAAETASWYI